MEEGQAVSNEESFSRDPVAALLVREKGRLYHECRMTPGPSGGGCGHRDVGVMSCLHTLTGGADGLVACLFNHTFSWHCRLAVVRFPGHSAGYSRFCPRRAAPC